MMKLLSRSFADNTTLPGRCAFAIRAPHGHVRLSANKNPQLTWQAVPTTTRSFVLTCIDIDAPTRAEDVNQPDRTVSAQLPRAEFVHWLMCDIPAHIRQIAEGACSQGIQARGKTAPLGPQGTQQGVNDYTGWFTNDAAMAGTYLGYDGPCPPWNDALVHRYRFEIVAVDVPSLSLDAGFTLTQLRTALDGHVLARAQLTGLYSLNPNIKLR